MTSLTALMRADAGAGATSAPAPAGDRFAALLAGDTPLAVPSSEPGIHTALGFAPDPATSPADALPMESPVVSQLPPFPPLTLPALRQLAATTGKALPAVPVDDASTQTIRLAGRHPELVPGSTVPRPLVRDAPAKAVVAPWTPEQIRGDDAGDGPDIGETVRGEDQPVDTGLPAIVAETSTTLPAVAPIPAVPLVQAPAAAPIPAQLAAVPVVTPQPLVARAEASVSAPAATASLSPTATGEAVGQIPVEAPRPVPAPVAPFTPPPGDAATTVVPAQAIAPAETSRVTANHRSPQPEAPARPMPRDPLPQPTPLAISATAPGTDRLLRARPNTAFAREEIAVTIVPVATPSVADAPLVRDAAPAQIDTRSNEWMHSMIERIETLTGEHGQRETRLKLSPDALGEVELRLRESPDGALVLDMDAVKPEARALLAEAAPRLLEMGEARGLRLSMQTGGGSSDGQHQREPHRPGADTPVPNRRPATAQGETDDERIA